MKPELIIAKLIDLTDELQEALADRDFGEEYDIMQTYFFTIHEAYRTLLLDLANLKNQN